MPLYEYQCEKCDHRFERIQKFSDRLVKICPKCKGKVRKLFSAPAIQFKGKGWYITDYARKGGAESDGREGKAAAEKTADEKSSGEKAAGEKAGKEKEGKEKKGDESRSKSSKKKA